MKPLVLLLFPLSILFASCNLFSEGIEGNGVIKTETRSAGSFRVIDVSGDIQVYISQAPAYSVRVETDENLMEFLEISTSGDQLYIGPRDNYNLHPSNKINVYVSAPSLTRFGASGACHFYSENKISSTGPLDIDLSGACHARLDLNAPEISAGLSGASSIELSGETKALNLGGSGSSDIKTDQLLAETVKIDISGAGNAEVFASVHLDVDISGAGSVRYHGNPSVSQNISGAGSISKTD